MVSPFFIVMLLRCPEPSQYEYVMVTGSASAISVQVKSQEKQQQCVSLSVDAPHYHGGFHMPVLALETHRLLESTSSG